MLDHICVVPVRDENRKLRAHTHFRYARKEPGQRLPPKERLVVDLPSLAVLSVSLWVLSMLPLRIRSLGRDFRGRSSLEHT